MISKPYDLEVSPELRTGKTQVPWSPRGCFLVNMASSQDHFMPRQSSWRQKMNINYDFLYLKDIFNPGGGGVTHWRLDGFDTL